MWNSATNSSVQANASTSKTDTSNDTGTESLTWISWFCSLSGHEYFAEVAEEFIEDDFNLTGLNSMVPFYKEALEMILDVESEEETLKVPDVSIVETSAELLYGLIHQRYIITRLGLQQMVDKYESRHFGCCPRVYCQSCPVIPCGRSDLPGLETVKLFCPNCLDLYTPPSSRFHNVDGAFFGTTFPHLLFQQYPDLLPSNIQTKIYEPKIFGFKVNEKSRSGPRMQWLRMRPGAIDNDVDGQDQSESGGGNEDGEDDEPLLGPGDGENNGSPGTTRRTEYGSPVLGMELGFGSSKGGSKQVMSGEIDKQEKPLTQKLLILARDQTTREVIRLKESTMTVQGSFGKSPLTKFIPFLSSPAVVTTTTLNQSSMSITNESSPVEPPPFLVSSSLPKNEKLKALFSDDFEIKGRGAVELVGMGLMSVKEMGKDFFDKWTGVNNNELF
ncbi:576_t:CDS:2 [Diversispora eburnea]|uniref:Casein kinase II subunit beta n=1 Tax=Diversispora eburnea TaxID=1213867 RepID=A0A9N8ZA14_9GLOM|nr:576_t:CDS:2 [Diversispora eburnea]